jgi:hypothetical protein
MRLRPDRGAVRVATSSSGDRSDGCSDAFARCRLAVVTVDPDVAITALFVVEIIGVLIGGSYLIRYELHRTATNPAVKDRASDARC